MTITAIVLAGGRSRRFGSDKLAAELDGAPLLSASVAAVAMVADRVIVAGAATQASPVARDPAVEWRLDDEPFGGPLAALSSVLDSAIASQGPEVALVVGGDMPRLVPAVLVAMVEVVLGDPEIEAVVLEASAAPRRQVLPLALRVEPAGRAARALLAAGDRSLRALIERLEARELPERAWRALDPQGDTLVDVDTGADLARLRHDAHRSPRP